MLWLLVCLGAGALIAFAIIRSRALDPIMDKKYPPKLQTVSTVCPHCGRTNLSFYTPGKDRYPYCTQCGDCLRHYGSEPQMTQEERDIIRCEKEICDQIDNWPQLPAIIDATWKYINTWSSAKSKGIVFTNGRAHYLDYNSATGKFVETTLITYPPTTRLGECYLSLLCMKAASKRLPGAKFEYGGQGFRYYRDY